MSTVKCALIRLILTVAHISPKYPIHIPEKLLMCGVSMGLNPSR